VRRYRLTWLDNEAWLDDDAPACPECGRPLEIALGEYETPAEAISAWAELSPVVPGRAGVYSVGAVGGDPLTEGECAEILLALEGHGW
jgi:hypothetical protein